MPRLIAAGADLDRVHLLERGHAWSFPRDLEKFGAYLRDNEITIVVLDPLDHHVDDLASQAGRQTLGTLAAIAETAQIGLIAVQHFNKTGKDIAAAVGGGRGVRGVARSILVGARSPSPAPTRENLERLGMLLAEGTLRIPGQTTYELAQAPEALAALTGQHAGQTRHPRPLTWKSASSPSANSRPTRTPVGRRARSTGSTRRSPRRAADELGLGWWELVATTRGRHSPPPAREPRRTRRSRRAPGPQVRATARRRPDRRADRGGCRLARREQEVRVVGGPVAGGG